MERKPYRMDFSTDHTGEHVTMWTYSALHLCSLNAEQRGRTCGYWYTVTDYGGTPHTAFRTRNALAAWLDLLGLTIKEGAPIPPHGEWGSFAILGGYRRALHMNPAALDALEGPRVRVLDNAEYTLGVVTTDPDGLRTIHLANANGARRTSHYAQSRERQDTGNLTAEG